MPQPCHVDEGEDAMEATVGADGVDVGHAADLGGAEDMEATDSEDTGASCNDTAPDRGADTCHGRMLPPMGRSAVAPATWRRECARCAPLLVTRVTGDQVV